MTSVNEIPEFCETFFEDLTLQPEHLQIVCGDFNLSHSSKNIKITQLKDISSSCNLNNLSNVWYTRETAKSRTNTDVVYCSKTVETEIIKLPISDHYTVEMMFFFYVVF